MAHGISPPSPSFSAADWMAVRCARRSAAETLDLDPADLTVALLRCRSRFAIACCGPAHRAARLGDRASASQARAHARDPRRSPYAPSAFATSAGLGQQRAHRPGRDRASRRNRWLSPAAGRRPASAFSMTEAGRRRADPTTLNPRRSDEAATGKWVRRPTSGFVHWSVADFLIVMPSRTAVASRAAPARVDDHRPDRHARRPSRATCRRLEHARASTRPARVTRRSSTMRARAAENLLGARGGRLPARPGAAHPGRSTPACAWLGVAR